MTIEERAAARKPLIDADLKEAASHVARHPLAIAAFGQLCRDQADAEGYRRGLAEAEIVPGQYGCGCPLVRSDRVRAFCSKYFEPMREGGEK